MKFSLAAFCFFGPFLYVFAQCSNSVSEFQLDGDYLIGGLFEIHHVNTPVQQNRPETIICSRFPFSSPNYRRFQLMRFAVEEINNLTNLLPNVYLGYELFDHCSDIQSFPGIFDLISAKQMMQSWVKPQTNNADVSKIIAVVGPFTSTQALTIAPLFMENLIPMVNYGSASSTFSSKERFPSFVRTVHPSKDLLEVIVNILLHFNWRWVAFLYNSNLYGNDGLDFFSQRIRGTEICLGYSKSLGDIATYYQMFQELEIHGINAVVVLSSTATAEDLIMSAIQLNITKKVWITGDTWSLNSMLPKMKGIDNIGTVLGVSQPVVTIPGFSDFVYSTKRTTYYENQEKQRLCSQFCLSGLTAEEILDSDPTYSFPVYSAVYAIAHALHNVLKCNADGCNCNITVYPHMVLAELKRSNFTLLNHSIEFDENGDPEFGSYSIVYWNKSGIAEEIGFAHFQPSWNFFINRNKIHWYTDGEVPTSLCSRECPEGFVKIKDGVHRCCFTCEICPKGTYFNITEDEYNCKNCKDTEWSAEGSTTCNPRSVEYIPFTDGGAIVIMVGSIALDGLIFSMSVLFTINYNTPVVKSAGGPMCFLTLGCLSLCSLSVFFYFGKPTNFSCIMRFLPFLLFYTVCLACFVVRSFQIVCIFKMAANFPKLYNWWMKYHGQWLLITMAFVTQTILLLICYVSATPKPYKDINWSPEEIILSCDTTIEAFSGSAALLVFLGSLCFIFSYLGKDLPKNYNEAKAITFCLLLLIFTWIMFATVLVLYQGKYIQTINALAVLASLYSFLLWYFLPKCYIIISQPHKNTQQYFQGLIQNYTKTISQ